MAKRYSAPRFRVGLKYLSNDKLLSLHVREWSTLGWEATPYTAVRRLERVDAVRQEILLRMREGTERG